MTQPDNQLHRFRNAFPNGHLLAPGDAGAANAVLEQAGLSDLTPVESVTPAGQGNMNLVLRVTGPSSTAILKQARPWVEKYPDIEAPAERAAVEAAFYRTIGQDPVAARAMPRLLGEAPESGAVVLEDLGRSEPLDTCYDGDPLDNETLAAVCRYAARLHTLEPANPILRNHAMRALNHAHIFALPLHRESGPDLDAITPGLQEAADELRKDHAFTNAVTSLGGQYLDDGPNLLHGDLHAGSILRTKQGLRIIDPEFTLRGPPALEFGIIIAHAVLSGRKPEHALAIATEHAAQSLDRDATLRFAGVEIMRRLVGVAQLPLEADLPTKTAWLDRSRQWVIQ